MFYNYLAAPSKLVSLTLRIVAGCPHCAMTFEKDANHDSLSKECEISISIARVARHVIRQPHRFELLPRTFTSIGQKYSTPVLATRIIPALTRSEGRSDILG